MSEEKRSSRRRREIDPTLNSLSCALADAERAADESMLPQTVFTDALSHGWANTWWGARRIERATKVHVTVLPARYFVVGEPQS